MAPAGRAARGVGKVVGKVEDKVEVDKVEVDKVEVDKEAAADSSATIARRRRQRMTTRRAAINPMRRASPRLPTRRA